MYLLSLWVFQRERAAGIDTAEKRKRATAKEVDIGKGRMVPVQGLHFHRRCALGGNGTRDRKNADNRGSFTSWEVQ